MPYKLAKYNLGEFPLRAWLYFASLYGTGERTYEAIQGIFIVAPLFGRVRTVLLHTDVDNVCRITSSTADPPGCRGNYDKFEEGGFFVVVGELGLHFLVDAEAGSGVCCCMTTVLTNIPVCGIRGIDLVAIGLPRAVEMCQKEKGIKPPNHP